jgi:16S rRNA (cytidine1402-2'-O)-methyltransferase
VEPMPQTRSEGITPETDRLLRLLMEELPLKQAVKLAAAISGEKKNALYEYGLTIKNNAND